MNLRTFIITFFIFGVLIEGESIFLVRFNNNTISENGIKPFEFKRGSIATYWDYEKKKIIRVKENEIRFERAIENKFWGNPIGIYLEGSSENYFLQSSFENEIDLWEKTEGIDIKKIKDGIEGDYSLYIKTDRGGRIYQKIELPVENEGAFHNQFCISFYVKRLDGGIVNENFIIPYASRKPNGINEINHNSWVYEDKDRTGIYRVIANFGHNGWRMEQKEWYCGIEIRGRCEMILDAVQVERGEVIGVTATSYIPTDKKIEKREIDFLSYNVKGIINLEEGTVGFWVYTKNPPMPWAYYITFEAEPYFFIHYQGAAIGGIGISYKFPSGGRWSFITLTWKNKGEEKYASLYINGKGDTNPYERIKHPFKSDIKFHEHIKDVWRCYISRYAGSPFGLISDLFLMNRCLDENEVRKIYREGL